MDDTNLKSKSDRHRHHPLSNVSMYVHIKCPTLSAGSSRFPIWRRQERGLDRTPLAETDWVPAFFWENPKTDLWSQIMQILHYQKNGRSAKGSFTMTTACPRAPREKKKNKKQQEQTDLHGEDKKKKQHKLGMNIRNVYISVWNTNVSQIGYTP